MVDTIRVRRDVGTPKERFVDVDTDELAKAVGSDLVWVPDSTLLLTSKHQGRGLAFTNACVITIPPGLRDGFSCGFVQAGAGQISFVPGSGVTLVSYQNLRKLAGQWAMGGLSNLGPELYTVYGTLA